MCECNEKIFLLQETLKTSMDTKIIFLYVTAPDLNTAENIGQTLVEKKLAACVNILPHMVSIYKWKGTIEKENEAILIVKTSLSLHSKVESEINSLHPYEVPCIAQISIENCNAPYLQWLLDNVNK